jgi:putative FmdB family regulatory protein
MPIYEYQCEQCGKLDEVIQKFSDKPLIKCKHCSGKLHKLISQSAFHLKGTGWYVTDYADKSRKDTKKNSEPEASKSAGSKEKKTASKSEKADTD